MNNKMVRFLNSLDIADVEVFDLDFDLVGMNPIDKTQVDMAIVKDTPWQYHLLERFQRGLSKITYPYTVTFSYKEKPSFYDAVHIIENWYRANYRANTPFEIRDDHGNIVLTFHNEQKRENFSPIMAELKDFFHFLCYEFAILDEFVPEEKAITVSASKLEALTKKAEKVIEEFESEEDEDTTYYRDPKSIEEQHKEELADVEKKMLSIMRSNKKAMLEDRKRQNSRAGGTYTVIESIGDIIAEGQRVDFVGKIFSHDKRIFGNGRNFLTLGVGDDRHAIFVKMFGSKNGQEDKFDDYKIGMSIRVLGVVESDKFNNELNVTGHNLYILPTSPLRKDPEDDKRVELHLHTKMSNMDGVGEIEKYVKVAK